MHEALIGEQLSHMLSLLERNLGLYKTHSGQSKSLEYSPILERQPFVLVLPVQGIK